MRRRVALLLSLAAADGWAAETTTLPQGTFALEVSYLHSIIDKAWDGNHTRYEVGAGYWIRSNLVIRGQIEFNQTERGRNLDDNVYSLGVGLSF